MSGLFAHTFAHAFALALAPAMGAFLTISIAWSARAAERADEPAAASQICMVQTAQVAGLDHAQVEAAVRIEQRKRGDQVSFVSVSRVDQCPTASPGRAVVAWLDASAVAWVSSGLDEPVEVELDDLDPVDRAPELARSMLAYLPTRGAYRSDSIVDMSEPLELPVFEPPRPSHWQGYAAVGGGYLREIGSDIDRGLLDAELGASVFDRRLAFGIRGRWLPPVAGTSSQSDSGVRTEVEASELLAVVRGGWWVGPALLRLGLGAGWERRTVVAHAAWRFDTIEVASDSMVLSAEPEALFDVGAGIFVTVSMTARWYLGGADYAWQGDSVHQAPSVTLAAVAGVGWAFP